MTGMTRWPLLVIAAPAAVSIWSGWVGLGAMSGFGDVQPFPGILPWHVDTALTLPLGIESYAALALGAWLRPGTKGKARKFARWSALGALVLGMLGQVSFHLLAARHSTRAPDIVVVLVACLPVVVLGCAVALLHLLAAVAPVKSDAARSAPARTQAPQPDAPGVRTRSAGTDAVEMHFAADLAAGAVPSMRRIQRELHVGQPRARALREHLETLITKETVS